MKVPAELLVLGRGYPHGNAVTNFTNAAANFVSTNSVNYNATSTTDTTFHNGQCRFALVCNDDPTNFLTVEVGSVATGSGISAHGTAPIAATAASRRVYPRSQEWFQLPSDGDSVLSIKADTATCAGAITWYP